MASDFDDCTNRGDVASAHWLTTSSSDIPVTFRLGQGLTFVSYSEILLTVDSGIGNRRSVTVKHNSQTARVDRIPPVGQAFPGWSDVRSSQRSIAHIVICSSVRFYEWAFAEIPISSNDFGCANPQLDFDERFTQN